MKKLTESAIRPKELMVQQKILALADAGRMLSRCDEFIYVSCPSCGSDNSSLKFIKNGIKYEECLSCETFYVNPRPSTEVLAWFYEGSPNYAYWSDVIFPASEDIRKEKIFVPRVDRLLDLCNKYKVNPGSLLEIGAGFGTFGHELKSRDTFNRIVAVEPTPNLANMCRERGLEVIEKPIEQIEIEDQFDVIVNFEVIEHLFSPADFIDASLKLLKPNGFMMITCPNGKGFDVETLGVVSDTVDHEHLNYFNPKSLGQLLSNKGLKILEAFTPGVLDADIVRNKILSGDYDISNQPFLKRILIDDWDNCGEDFQKYLTKSDMSSNLWIVAQKKSD